MKVAVIGSGPSGWIAAKKLIELGHDVTVLDSALVESDPYRKEDSRGSSSLSKKLFFGSDLPYRMFPTGNSPIAQGVNPISSFARGGLSLVWGATMLPYCSADTSKWPIEISNFNSRYTEIAKYVPITGNSDGLSRVYGDFISRRGILPSTRVVKFLEGCNRTPTKTIHVGLSRLAVETGKDEIKGCVYCNKCIGGCPTNQIWNTQAPISGVSYIKMRVTRLAEDDSGVTVEGYRIDGTKSLENSFEKIFMACGPIETFTILAASGLVVDQALLKDSATFFLPMVALPRLGNAKNNSFGLAQIFLRLDKTPSNPASQFQIYEYSDDLISRAQKAVPFGRLIPDSLLKVILKRMVVAIGYLDGEDSPSIMMRLLKNGSVHLEVNNDGNGVDSRSQSIKLAIRKFGGFARKNGLMPMGFLTQVAQPGEGVHFGSWLPMGEKSDLLGRPKGSQNIHVIDSSVLPSIAPGPITFTVMANAMRIVEGVAQ
jgi:hypothetical protein